MNFVLEPLCGVFRVRFQGSVQVVQICKRREDSDISQMFFGYHLPISHPLNPLAQTCGSRQHGPQLHFTSKHH